MTSLLTNSHILLTLLVAICKMFSLTKKKKKNRIRTYDLLFTCVTSYFGKTRKSHKGTIVATRWTILDSHWRKIWQDEKERGKKRFCCTALTIAFDHQ